MDGTGSRRPTLEDVARLAGVSRATASRAVNGDPRVARSARHRVEAAVAELGWVPNQAARALASRSPPGPAGVGPAEEWAVGPAGPAGVGPGASPAFGPAGTPGVGLAGERDTDTVHIVVVADPADLRRDPYFGRVLLGALQGLGGTDARVRLRVTPEWRVQAAISAAAARRCLGLILVNVTPTVADGLRLPPGGVISLGPSAPGVPWIDIDNLAGARAAVRSLLRTGRRRIAAIGGPAASVCAAGRRDGYLLEVREAGRRAVVAHGGWARRDGLLATRRLLAAHPEVDAIFAASDLVATGVLQALAEHGRRVPDDVAVVGFDDSPLAECTNPPLTTVFHPVERIAAVAAQALAGGAARRGWQVIEPTSLVVRESSSHRSG
jgi:DNA-binding LacI/PurR family transcriptional regulator